MKVIALDISRQSTGVAIGDGNSPPRNFRASFKGETLGVVGHSFRAWMRELLVLDKPDLICIEAAFVGKTDDAYTATLMLGLNFMAQSVAAGRGIQCQTVAVQTWRKAFIGQGRPDNPKRASIEMCKLVGWEVEGNHDRAEACGIFAWGHLMHGNRDGVAKMLSAGSVRSMVS